jgi:hypothetical protein
MNLGLDLKLEPHPKLHLQGLPLTSPKHSDQRPLQRLLRVCATGRSICPM